MIKNKMDLMYIRHNRLIEDPFPDHTAYSYEKGFLGDFLEPFMSTRPREISIWEAYRMGYEKAYKEIEAILPNN